jgi:predicted dehydrogenase
MTSQPFRVGIVGLQPGRSWAAKAHVPALRALSEDFVIAGIANTTLASAVQAAATLDHGPRPFVSVADLVASPDIDVVSVTVRVPYHIDVVKTAITAGKHVYCEWPLGNGLAEAQELARLAKEKGVLGVVGMQACLAPEILYLKQLIADGFVGEVLSTTLIARGGGWGGVIPEKKNHVYLLDNTNGATMLTVPVGHALAGLQAVLGDVEKVSAILATRRSTVLAVDSGEKLTVTAPDHERRQADHEEQSHRLQGQHERQIDLRSRTRNDGYRVKASRAGCKIRGECVGPGNFDEALCQCRTKSHQSKRRDDDDRHGAARMDERFAPET